RAVNIEKRNANSDIVERADKGRRFSGSNAFIRSRHRPARLSGQRRKIGAAAREMQHPRFDAVLFARLNNALATNGPPACQSFSRFAGRPELRSHVFGPAGSRGIMPTPSAR